MISFYFHPDYSGSAIQAFNLCRHLQPLGVEPLIVAANLGGHPSHDTLGGIPIHRLPLLKTKDLQIPSFAVSLLRFLFAHRDEYDVIHAHGTLPHAAASIAGRRLGKPTILKVAMANSDIAFRRQGRLRGPINRALVSRFDSYIATTPDIVTEFASEGLDSRRVELVPNGVDTETFAPVPDPAARAAIRRRLGLPGGPIVSYVGIISSRKNVDGILRVWQRVCAAHPQAHLALVGPKEDSDPFLKEVLAYVAQHGLQSRVTFTGRQDPVAPYLQVSDAFIFPSRREGMANSVLEAMSCGLPCLVSNAAGVSAVIDTGRNGYALDVDDEGAFSDTLLALITDRSLRDRVGAAARSTIVDTLSLTATALRYRDLYAQLLDAQERVQP